LSASRYEIAKEFRSVSPAVLEWDVPIAHASTAHRIRLVVEARIDWPYPAGSNPWVRISVNGHQLGPDRLLNKTNDFMLADGRAFTWYHSRAWRVVYAPDFEAVARDRGVYRIAEVDEPYRYVWDITALVKPGGNSLSIEHLQVLPKPDTLVLRTVHIEVTKRDSTASSAHRDFIGDLPVYVTRPTGITPIAAVLWDGGSIDLRLKNAIYSLQTRISQPAGAWLRTRAGALSQALMHGQAGSVGWTAGALRVERRVSVRADHLKIEDTFRNAGQELLGLIVEHHATGGSAPGKVFLGGVQKSAAGSSAREPSNPSTFAQGAVIGLGLVAEDDIFRVHVRSFAAEGSFGIADDSLGLAPNSQVTLEWSVYPVEGDYWTFVNAVRRNWDSAVTVPGAFAFARLPDDKPASWYLDWLTRRSITVVAGDIPKFSDRTYAHGSGVLFAGEWLHATKKWMSRVRSAAPDATVLAYFHGQISMEPGATAKYFDARLVDVTGKHGHYPSRYHVPLPLFLPTHRNSYGQALRNALDLLIEGSGANGIYWDEMAYSVAPYAIDTEWDGVSAEIDPVTHVVRGRRTSVALATQPLWLDLVRRIRGAGLVLIANTPPATRTMHEQRFVRFAETLRYSALAGTHLYSPVGLGNHRRETTQRDAVRNLREILQWGAVYYGHTFDREAPKWSFTSILYPITPMEIYEGVVVGRERIHTIRSGVFGWADKALADVHIINENGDRLARSEVDRLASRIGGLYHVRLPQDHFAVLVKR
jgi:hypothetical protein